MLAIITNRVVRQKEGNNLDTAVLVLWGLLVAILAVVGGAGGSSRH